MVPKILIVEDEPDMVELLYQTLSPNLQIIVTLKEYTYDCPLQAIRIF